MSHTPDLTLYFDGSCPICVAEVRRPACAGETCGIGSPFMK
jgi:hypothetical protein